MAFGDVTSYQMSRLACDRWLPDTLLEGMASLLNRSSQDCLCLVLPEVCKFTLNKSIASALNNRKKIRLIFLIVHVQIDAITGSSVGSNTLMSGNHWTVVALDLNSKASFYGDPLGYPVPSNLLVELIQTLGYLSTALGERVDIHDLIPMHRPTFDKDGKHACSRHSKNFPIQTYSSLCGLIAFVFVAVAAFSPENLWAYICSPQLSFYCDKAKLKLYLQPSHYAHYLRNTLAVWLLSAQIKISNILDKSILADENLQSQQIQSHHLKQPEPRKLCLSLSKTLKTKVSGEKCNSSAASPCKATTDQPSCYMPDKANKVGRKNFTLAKAVSAGKRNPFLSNVTWCTSNESHSQSTEADNVSETSMPAVEQQSVYVKTCTLSTDTFQQFQTTSEANLEQSLDAKHECKSDSGLPTSIIPLLPQQYNYFVDSYCQHESESFLGAETSNFTLEAWTSANCETAAVQWIKHFEEVSKITNRITTGFRSKGLRFVFKTVRHCHHYRKQKPMSQMSTESKCKLKKTTIHCSTRDKKSMCPSTLIVRVYPPEASKISDHPEYPCLINLKYTHNHPIHSGHALSFRPVTKAVKKAYISLFESGSSAASARHE